LGAQDERVPGWYELPFKRLIKYIILALIIGTINGWIGTRIFNIDLMILAFHVQNLWLIIPEGVTLSGAVWLWNWSRTSEKKKRQKQAKQQLQKLIHDAGDKEAK
jgi:hypothetical protein